MVNSAGISTRFPPGIGPGVIAARAGLIGATPGGVLRYLAYRLAGHNETEARERVIPLRNLSSFNSRPREEVTQIPVADLEAIRARHPGKPISYLLRFQAAKEAGADDALADEIASSITVGRPKGAKDLHQRTRRTNAELTTASEAITT